MDTDDTKVTTSTTILLQGDGLPWWRRRRIHICILSFVGNFISYTLRVNLSIAIVAMTNPAVNNVNDVKESNATGTATIIQNAEFDWDLVLQGVILSSFYYGYIITLFLGGWLSARYGGHLMMAESVAIPAFLTLFTPMATKLGFTGIIAIRILIGMFCGPASCCNHDIWARWSPSSEKTWLLAVACSGSNFGTLTILVAGGLVADTLGWPYLFYIPGSLGVVWTVLWMLVVRKSPELDKSIDQKELEYIKRNCESNLDSKIQVKNPWKQIFTSGPYWSHIISLISCHWFFYIMLTQAPTYITDILEFDLTDVGFISAIPYITMSLCMPCSGILADWCISNLGLNPTLVRKVWTGIGFIGQTIFLLLQAVIVSKIGIIICLTFANFFHAIVNTVITVNTLDLSRAHASVLFGISNTFGCLVGIIAPTVTGYITQDKEMYEWMILFGLIGVLSIFSTIIFACFGSGETQPWAKEK